jgi:hypothetical protein
MRYWQLLRNSAQENTNMKKKKWSFWKGVGLMFKILGLIVVVAMLTPIGFFAWRAGQPMSMPEYGGRTYYELLAERRQAYADLARTYQAGHPSVEVKDGMCFQNEVIMSIGYTLPWAGFCALSDVIPSLKGFIGPKARQSGCGADENNKWLNILNSWWINFERMQYPIYDHRTVGPVAYCRIPAP